MNKQGKYTNKAQLEKTLSRYLERYAEVEVQEFSSFLDSSSLANSTYKHCIVLPLYNEDVRFFTRFSNSVLSQQHVLIIAVINQPDNDLDTQKNQTLWNELVRLYSTGSIRPKVFTSSKYQHLHIPNTHTDIILVDRFSEPNRRVPYKNGVGLARKLGSDMACRLMLQPELRKRKKIDSLWIHHTDADVQLPDNYFSSLNQAIDDIPSSKEKNNAQINIEYSAAVYRYIHVDNNTADKDGSNGNHTPLLRATRLYEQSLNYYVDKLKEAGSPYAYHTLGSSMATHAYHYCQARGFPQRAGGEDFYLLNKLAKLGKVKTLEDSTLHIDARVSERVPFGTGPAVKKILAMNNTDTEYLYYHPQCFKELAHCLQQFAHLFSYKYLGSGTHHSHASSYHTRPYQQWLITLSQPLQDALLQLGIDSLFAHIEKQIKSPEQCIQHCHEWLDGFRTLKLIHLLESTYPKQTAVQLQELRELHERQAL